MIELFCSSHSLIISSKKGSFIYPLDNIGDKKALVAAGVRETTARYRC